jgi:hypothetical protein
MEDKLLAENFSKQQQKHLLYSILIDVIGMISFVIPVLAEVSDIIIAPFLALAIFAVHKTPIGSISLFAEEILPGTDIIPTATLVWYYKYQMNRDETFAAFQDKNQNLLP